MNNKDIEPTQKTNDGLFEDDNSSDVWTDDMFNISNISNMISMSSNPNMHMPNMVNMPINPNMYMPNMPTIVNVNNDNLVQKNKK